MSLPLLVAIVVAGIAAVVFAVHLAGGSRVARLADGDAARERFADDYPDLAVRRVVLTADAGAAVLEIDDGRIGLVHALGGRFLTRLLGPADLSGAPRASGNRLALRVRDFTWPGAVLEFASAQDAEAVETLFARQRSSGLWKDA